MFSLSHIFLLSFLTKKNYIHAVWFLSKSPHLSFVFCYFFMQYSFRWFSGASHAYTLSPNTKKCQIHTRDRLFKCTLYLEFSKQFYRFSIFFSVFLMFLVFYKTKNHIIFITATTQTFYFQAKKSQRKRKGAVVSINVLSNAKNIVFQFSLANLCDIFGTFYINV